MRRRGEAVFVLALVAGLLALPASAQLVNQAGAGGVVPAPEGGITDLYVQTDNASGNGAPDQNFEAAYNAYDSEGADDFEVDWPDGWVVQQVRTVGTQSAGGSATSVDVNFYPDNAGFPGNTAACSYAGIVPTQAAGSFTIDLPTDCNLPAGFWWVAIQTTQTFGGGNGQHFWSNRTSQSNQGGVWRNPGDGFGSGCTDWDRMTTCGVGGGTNPDFLFVIAGELGVPPPPPAVVPTLDVVGLLALMALLAGTALFVMRRRQSSES